MPHTTYMAERMGSATIAPRGNCEAGSFQAFTLTYTAGFFGIDDTGSIKIVFRFASDMGKPQFTEPKAAGYTTVEASNGAVFEIAWDQKRNIRPWDKTLFIRVVRGFLREGDRITVRFGDRRGGSPGIRVQTMVEPRFEFKVLVDPFATYNYCELPDSPVIAVVPGQPERWKAVLPTLKGTGEAFALGVKAEDRWGNPSDLVDAVVTLEPTHAVEGLPRTLTLRPGVCALRLGDLKVARPCDLRIRVHAADGRLLTSSNPLRIVARPALGAYWADLHGQSEETIGTNAARELFEFARDRAFLDVMSHQGNDFQITTPFWHEINRLTASFNRDGAFICFPGYEWSGNTGLGGDRNVMFMHEGRQIHRSSHALIEDLTDAHTDAHSAEDLFQALKDEDCVVFAHVGGRYADVKIAHDARLERSIEIHSDWGSFEWLLHDALEKGYRVGILANSDGHKGRQGASYPGASLFGAYGGLSCIRASALTRGAIFDALRKRHHYATTGCRMVLEVGARFDSDAELFDDDPQLGSTGSHRVQAAVMGDILRSGDAELTLDIEALADAPIERLEIRNRFEVLETVRPYTGDDLGRRIRVIWEGSEYRGRGRQSIWDGTAELVGNRFERADPINFYNLDKTLEQHAPDKLGWRALTTGGFGGFDATLADPRAGLLKLDTVLVKAEIPVAEIGLDDHVLDSGGGMARRIRVFRLPDRDPTDRLKLTRRVKLRAGADNALYVCLTQLDGHLVWSSPIYVFR